MKNFQLFSKTFFVLTLVLSSFINCTSPPPVEVDPPTASFTVDENIVTNNTIQFTSNSLNGGTDITSWSWSFEEGTPATSKEENPKVTFASKGKYRVSLTVTNSVGSNTTSEEYIVIEDCQLYNCEKFLVEKQEGLTYGVSSTYHKMNIYTPVGDNRTSKPAILINGGGFYNGSDLSKLEYLAEKLTSYGFVVATARYRNRLDDNGTKTLMRGMVDSKAAVRFLRSKAGEYNLDADKIFVGGWSSGAYSALVHAYWQESDPSSQLLQMVINNGWITSWEGEQGNAGYSSKVNGVINLAGSIYGQDENFKNDLWISANEVPMFAVYGEKDTELPCGSLQSSTSSNWEFGPCTIHERLTSLNIQSELKIIAGGVHEAPRESSNINNYLPELIDFLVANLN